MSRFTDFLVYEVDQDGNVIRLKSLEMPSSSKHQEEPVEDVTMGNPAKTELQSEPQQPEPAADTEQPAEESAPGQPEPENEPVSTKEEPWPEAFTATLSPFFSEDGLAQLKQMFLEGPEPPRVSDNGWAGRPTKPAESADAAEEVPSAPPEEASSSRGKRGRDRGRRGGRGHGRGGGRGGSGREDTRRAISNVRSLSCILGNCLTETLFPERYPANIF
jgi:tRNA pseudouridine13 synthase